MKNKLYDLIKILVEGYNLLFHIFFDANELCFI